MFVPFVSTTCHDFRRTNVVNDDEPVYSPRLPWLRRRTNRGRKEWRRVGGCIKARYEANHGADGNKYFIASKTYHLPIERMNYSV